MDKKLVQSVAGAGKTTYIVDSLSLDNRVGIITYTIANQQSLTDMIIDRFGTVPSNIHVFGFWQFIYGFCLVPNISALPKGIIFDQKIISTEQKKRRQKGYGTNGYFFSNMISKYLIDEKVGYIERIEYFFDELYVDEVQDFNSYDIDWICSLAKAKIRVCLMGDYFQRTFLTSVSGNKSKGITKNFNTFKKAYEDAGYEIDEDMLVTSYRCSKNICEFIRNKLEINIQPNRKNIDAEVQFVSDADSIRTLLLDDDVKKLFYQKHYSYKCNSINWGESKGLTFIDICVVLNGSTYKEFKADTLKNLAVTTKAKFYVACTRARRNVYFIDEKSIPNDFVI